MSLPGVITFRDVNDIWAMWHRAGTDDRVVVIGGGLLGLEAAYGSGEDRRARVNPYCI